MNNIPVQIKLGIAAITALLCATACSPLNEPAQTVMTEIAASTGSAVHASSEASASESESSSSLSSYISEVSSSESSQTETSETSSEDISSSSDVEATVKAEEIRAAEKAKQEEELRIQQAEQEKARQEAEAALKAEQEKSAASQGSSPSSSSSSQAEKPSTPAEKPAEEPTQSEPQSVAQQSGKYALNEYGNPSLDVLRTKVKVMVNPADPAIQERLGGRGTLDPNVRIPNPWASMQPVSPYIGQANPPAAWPKPTPQGHGEYKWSPEAGCWRYYSGGKAYDKYVSIYGVETWAQSYLEKTNPGASVLKEYSSAHSMGIYGV